MDTSPRFKNADLFPESFKSLASLCNAFWSNDFEVTGGCYSRMMELDCLLASYDEFIRSYSADSVEMSLLTEQLRSLQFEMSLLGDFDGLLNHPH